MKKEDFEEKTHEFGGKYYKNKLNDFGLVVYKAVEEEEKEMECHFEAREASFIDDFDFRNINEHGEIID